jgi:hypothetical protein
MDGGVGDIVGELTVKGHYVQQPDPVQFRAALVKAGFYPQWHKTYGMEA